MARPHIESIQSQLLPWTKGDSIGPRPDVEVRTLSVDDETGAASLVLRYPPGWSRTEPEVLLIDEEFFVLAGDLEIGGVPYGLHDYANLPAGYPRASASSRKGAIVLTFYSAALAAEPAMERNSEFDDALLVEKLSTIDMDWFRQGLPKDFNAKSNLDHYDLGRKLLRTNPYNQEHTSLFCASPQTYPPPGRCQQEAHPTVEEAFSIAGELICPKEVRKAGAYFWRPPMIDHGPFGSITGAVEFIRTKGGRMYNHWSKHEIDFSLDPEHNPMVPKELEPYGTNHWDRTLGVPY